MLWPRRSPPERGPPCSQAVLRLLHGPKGLCGDGRDRCPPAGPSSSTPSPPSQQPQPTAQPHAAAPTCCLVQGIPPSEIAEQTIGLATRLLERFCRSRVLLVGLLPVVEKAKYDAYEYKSVEPEEESRRHFAKISLVNAALASFAAERGAQGAAYAGCHDLFLDRVDDRNIDRLLLKDGVHFTKPGEQLFFRCLKEDLQAAEELQKVPMGLPLADGCPPPSSHFSISPIHCLCIRLPLPLPLSYCPSTSPPPSLPALHSPPALLIIPSTPLFLFPFLSKP